MNQNSDQVRMEVDVNDDKTGNQEKNGYQPLWQSDRDEDPTIKNADNEKISGEGDLTIAIGKALEDDEDIGEQETVFVKNADSLFDSDDTQYDDNLEQTVESIGFGADDIKMGDMAIDMGSVSQEDEDFGKIKTPSDDDSDKGLDAGELTIAIGRALEDDEDVDDIGEQETIFAGDFDHTMRLAGESGTDQTQILSTETDSDLDPDIMDLTEVVDEDPAADADDFAFSSQTLDASDVESDTEAQDEIFDLTEIVDENADDIAEVDAIEKYPFVPLVDEPIEGNPAMDSETAGDAAEVDAIEKYPFVPLVDEPIDPERGNDADVIEKHYTRNSEDTIDESQMDGNDFIMDLTEVVEIPSMDSPEKVSDIMGEDTFPGDDDVYDLSESVEKMPEKSVPDRKEPDVQGQAGSPDRDEASPSFEQETVFLSEMTQTPEPDDLTIDDDEIIDLSEADLLKPEDDIEAMAVADESDDELPMTSGETQAVSVQDDEDFDDTGADETLFMSELPDEPYEQTDDSSFLEGEQLESAACNDRTLPIDQAEKQDDSDSDDTIGYVKQQFKQLSGQSMHDSGADDTDQDVDFNGDMPPEMDVAASQFLASDKTEHVHQTDTELFSHPEDTKDTEPEVESDASAQKTNLRPTDKLQPDTESADDPSMASYEKALLLSDILDSSYVEDRSDDEDRGEVPSEDSFSFDPFIDTREQPAISETDISSSDISETRESVDQNSELESMAVPADSQETDAQTIEPGGVSPDLQASADQEPQFESMPDVLEINEPDQPIASVKLDEVTDEQGEDILEVQGENDRDGEQILMDFLSPVSTKKSDRSSQPDTRGADPDDDTLIDDIFSLDDDQTLKQISAFQTDLEEMMDQTRRKYMGKYQMLDRGGAGVPVHKPETLLKNSQIANHEIQAAVEEIIRRTISENFEQVLSEAMEKAVTKGINRFADYFVEDSTIDE